MSEKKFIDRVHSFSVTTSEHLINSWATQIVRRGFHVLLLLNKATMRSSLVAAAAVDLQAVCIPY